MLPRRRQAVFDDAYFLVRRHLRGFPSIPQYICHLCRPDLACYSPLPRMFLGVARGLAVLVWMVCRRRQVEDMNAGAQGGLTAVVECHMKEPSSRRGAACGAPTSFGEGGEKVASTMRLLALAWGLIAAMVILAGGCALAGASKDKEMTKISRDLVALYDAYVLYQQKGEDAAFTPSNPMVRVSEGHVMIDAVASGDADALRADLEALGLLQAAAFGRMVSGRLPIEAIDDLSALASLQFVRPAYAQTHSGSRRPGVLQRPAVQPLDKK